MHSLFVLEIYIYKLTILTSHPLSTKLELPRRAGQKLRRSRVDKVLSRLGC
jgi:hypothetical protein